MFMPIAVDLHLSSIINPHQCFSTFFVLQPPITQSPYLKLE